MPQQCPHLAQRQPSAATITHALLRLLLLLPTPAASASGLGLLSPLPDELLLDLLFGLPAADLARLGLASKALYCFAHTSELWKALVIQVRLRTPASAAVCTSSRQHCDCSGMHRLLCFTAAAVTHCMYAPELQ
jgi:hypothetical protein